MHSRNTHGCPLSSWRMSVPGLHQSLTKVTHVAESVSSAPRVLLCRCSPVSLLSAGTLRWWRCESWTERRAVVWEAPACPSLGSSLEEQDQRGRKLSSLLSALFPISVPAVCSGTEALGSCSSWAEWESRSSGSAEISHWIWRPGVRGMDGRGPRAVCSLTLQCVPRLKSLSSYSSQESLDSHSTGKTPEEGWSTLEPQVLPKAAVSLQILATLLHITTVRKCEIHLPRFNRLHLSSSHSRAATSTSNSFPQAAEFVESCIEKSHAKVNLVLQIPEMKHFPLAF